MPEQAPVFPKNLNRPPIEPTLTSIHANGRELANSPKLDHRFSIEAGVIADALRAQRLSAYVDLGCWYGFLLKKVLDFHRPQAVVAVDAIPAVLEFAREHVNQPLVQFVNAAVTPRRLEAKPPDVRVHPWDTSRSGLFVDGGTVIANVPYRSVADLVSLVGPDRVPSTYVKIDLEGCDDDAVCDILDSGLRPAAIHFEVFTRDLPTYRCFAALRSAGYQIPSKIGHHGVYSYVCGQAFSRLIGFDPDVAYDAA